MTTPKPGPAKLDELERCATAAALLADSADHWAAEMERAASAVEDAGADVAVIDGNRAIAAVLRDCAKALRADPATVLALVRVVRAAIERAASKNDTEKFNAEGRLDAALEPFRP